MDTSDLVPLIELLDDNIDDLEQSLGSLLKSALTDTVGKLPLLDKAQLYVLVTYAIESILFSYLRLNGVDAKEHPVFRELIRVKQYFEKIKNAECGDTSKKSMIVDKAAAGRFIKHALAANESSGITQARQNQTTKSGYHLKFEQVSKKRKTDDDDQAAAPPAQASQSSSSGSQQLTSGAATPDLGAQSVIQDDHRLPSKRKKKRSKHRREG